MNLCFTKDYASELENSIQQLSGLFNNVSKLGTIHILYLEDNRADADFLTNIIDFDSVEIDVADSFHSAVIKLNNNNYDAFVIDIILNDKYSGIDFIDLLNQRKIKKPIVVLTNKKHHDTIKTCYEKGIVNFFEKDELVSIINNNEFFKKLLNRDKQ